MKYLGNHFLLDYHPKNCKPTGNPISTLISDGKFKPETRAIIENAKNEGESFIQAIFPIGVEGAR